MLCSLQTKDEKEKFKVNFKGKILFTFFIKSNKIPKNKPKETKDLYSENYKMLMKKIEEINR